MHSAHVCGNASVDRPAPFFGVGAVVGDIVNLPADALRVKVRMRVDDFACVYVKTPDAVTEYVLCQDVDGNVCIAYPQNKNVRVGTPPPPPPPPPIREVKTV